MENSLRYVNLMLNNVIALVVLNIFTTFAIHLRNLGCSNEEIAAHFIKYFSGDILESMYGDLDGFKVIF